MDRLVVTCFAGGIRLLMLWILLGQVGGWGCSLPLPSFFPLVLDVPRHSHAF